MRMISFLTAAILVTVTTALLKADDHKLIESGRKVLKVSESALVGVTAIAKIQIKATGATSASIEREIKIDCTSLVIEASGLSVTSLTNLNPQNAMPRMRAQGRGGEPTELTFECELRGIKMRLPDGTEIPARILLKDDDLDLAYLAPSDPLSDANKKKLAVISLEAPKTTEVLDPIIQLGRTSKDFNYAPAVQLGHIAAVLKKPRTYFLGSTSSLGSPVFNEQGKLIGMVARFISAEKESAGDTLTTALRSSQSGGGTLHVIVPTADIAKLVDQAKEAAKKPAPKED